MDKNIAFIGSGHMAASLIGGLVNKDYPPQHIWASDPNPEKLQALQQRFGIQVATDNYQAVANADIVVFAIKPQVFAALAQELASTLQQCNPLVISIAAGINIAHIEQWLGKQLAIIRCMPNTPAMIGYGATGMYANQQVTLAQKQQAQHILAAVGLALWLEQESMLDIVTAVSGSGPAYFFLILEAIVDAAQALGLPAEIAQALAVQTALGSAKMANQAHSDLKVLRQQVTSPGGTTEQAIKVLEAGGIRELLAQALAAAKKRSVELATLSK